MTKHCVNPQHLEPVTALENTRRARRVMPRRTHCKRGHELSAENIAREGEENRRRCKTCRKAKRKERRKLKRKPPAGRLKPKSKRIEAPFGGRSFARSRQFSAISCHLAISQVDEASLVDQKRLSANARGVLPEMLSDALRELLLNGPHPDQRARGLVRFGGAATVLVQWRRHREELLASCPPGH